MDQFIWNEHAQSPVTAASADSMDRVDRRRRRRRARRWRRQQHSGPVSRPCSLRSPSSRDRGHADTSVTAVGAELAVIPLLCHDQGRANSLCFVCRRHGSLFSVRFSMSFLQQQRYAKNVRVNSLQEYSHLRHCACCILSLCHIRRRRRRLGSRRRRRRQHFRH